VSNFDASHFDPQARARHIVKLAQGMTRVTEVAELLRNDTGAFERQAIAELDRVTVVASQKRIPDAEVDAYIAQELLFAVLTVIAKRVEGAP
jgi:hypothetical protein